ncbi:MAG: hypothetical protein E6R04_09460 [Spirochaetes bacterium]|jgi:hypothetical protein|nr:MAG: hypothetical protein E6R04_09460 [Spirochaetota bacterium]
MQTRAKILNRLSERLEEFVDEYKHDLDADEVAIIEDAIGVVEKVKDSQVDDEEDEDGGVED